MIRVSYVAALTLASAMALAACGGDSPKKYSIGGSVSGLSGTGLILQSGVSADLGVAANGPFTFSGKSENGGSYAVSVRAQPTNPSQTCQVSNGVGSVQGANITNISVACTTNTYKVGGTITGLIGSGLRLQSNGANDLSPGGNGAFEFSGVIASGQPYAVTVVTQPANPAQTCALTRATGTVRDANVTDVAIECTTNTYRVGGIVTGLAGSGLTLQNNGANDLAISGDGAFEFSAAVPSNGSYAATISGQPTSPWQTCVVANASGVVTNNDVSTITVSCTTNKYALRGSVQGLSPSQFREPLVLSNGADEVDVMDDGSFALANVASGRHYDVAVRTQPAKPTLSCSVQHGTGVVSNADVSDVTVTCEPTGATFVYATSYVQALSILRIGPDHSLQMVEEMPTISTPTSVTVDPSGQFVYLATLDAQGTILAYGISPTTGRLTPIGTGIVTGAGPKQIVTDPSGEFVFVGNQYGGPTNQGSISVFKVDSTNGGLTEVPGSEFTHGQTVYGIGVDSTGRFVYTANAAGYTAGLRVDRQTGALTPLPGSPYATGNVPFSVAVDPLGRFVYTVTGANSDGIFAYSINSTSGVLSQLPNSSIPVPTDNCIVIHPSGRFLYNLVPWSSPSPHISVFSIGASGALTAIPGSPFADPDMTRSGAFDPTGRFLYVTNLAATPTGGGVQVYAVDPNSGSLSAVSPTSVQIATNPTSIAVR